MKRIFAIHMMVPMGSIVVSIVALGASPGCAVDDRSDQPLAAAYSGEHGFGFESASTARLAEVLRPHDSVEVVVGGARTPLAAMQWGEAIRADQGQISLEATDGAIRRFLGALQLTEGAPLRSYDTTETGIPGAHASPSVVPATSCTNNAHAFFCDNCQCSPDGFSLRGESQRYICIEGSWYSENVWACNCQFTAHVCGTI